MDSPDESDESEGSGSGTTRLLVVDDDPVAGRTLRRVLERAEFECEQAEDPVEALRILSERPIALLICDHILPGMSGLDLIREALGARPTLAAVMISGDESAELAAAAREVGAAACLTKPVGQRQLLAVVAEVLAARGEPSGTAGGRCEASDGAAGAAGVPRVVDWEGLLERVGGDDDTAHEVADVFCGDAPRKVAALLEALRDDRLADVRLLAHTLKGAAASAGAERMAALVAEVERASLSGDPRGALDAASELELELELFHSSL
jgi:CheY-like chemotaxis protein/HPt (histidine-containing phosphotransfer) domain-containing protein